MNTYHSLFKEIINNTQQPSSFHYGVTGRNVELQCKTRFHSCLKERNHARKY